MTVEKQVVQIYAATQKDENEQNWIRPVPVDQVVRYMTELLAFVETRHGALLKLIAEKRELVPELRKGLDAALREFRSVFQADAA
jgi:F-type H+-transporting ATPase subunit alpha